ncbi:MAG: DsbA family protein [Alphaproteobacteria bacterium]|nr:DsbA family protein [Alphaproteobacteria bacterium]
MRYIVTSLIFFILLGEAHADKPAPIPKTPLPEVSMGSAKAPVVVINYSSFTCTHCANFHTDVLPKVVEEYIKSGKVRIIFRDYPGDQLSVQAHQLAWCQGELKYLNFSKVFYSTQDKWLTEKDPIKALKEIALKNGLTKEQIDACLKNQELLDKILQVRIDGQKKYKITATPTIIINAKIYPRTLSFKEFKEAVDPLLKPKIDKASLKENRKS